MIERIMHSAFEWIIFGVATQVAKSLRIGWSGFPGLGKVVKQLGIGWCNLLGFIRVQCICMQPGHMVRRPKG